MSWTASAMCWRKAASHPARSPAPESAIRPKRWWSGMRRPAGRCIRPSSGNAAAARPMPRPCCRPARKSAHGPGSIWIDIHRHQVALAAARAAGDRGELANGRALWGTWIAGWSMPCPAAAPMSPSRACLAHHAVRHLEAALRRRIFRIFGLALALRPEVSPWPLRSDISPGIIWAPRYRSRHPRRSAGVAVGHGCSNGHAQGQLRHRRIRLARRGSGATIRRPAGCSPPSPATRQAGLRAGRLRHVCGCCYRLAAAYPGPWQRPEAVTRLAREAAETGGVTVVPAFQGLGSPWWDAEARASILGLSAGSERAQICRAGLEAICFQTRAVLEAMARVSGKAATLVERRWRHDPQRRHHGHAGGGAENAAAPRRDRPCGGAGRRADGGHRRRTVERHGEKSIHSWEAAARSTIASFATEPWDDRYAQWRAAVDLTRQWKIHGRA